MIGDAVMDFVIGEDREGTCGDGRRGDGHDEDRMEELEQHQKNNNRLR